MSISLDSIVRTGDQLRPPIITVYGPGKIGKTTLAAAAPNPIMIRTEDGADSVDVAAFPMATSYEDVMGQLGTLATEEHDYRSLVVDSLDWLEPHVWKHVCQKNGWSSLEEPGYGKGYIETLEPWRNYIMAIKYLRDEREMAIIQIAHHQIKQFTPPDTDPYNQYQIKLHQSGQGMGANPLIQEDSDAILFMNHRVHVKTTDGKFGGKTKQGVGTGERVIYTTPNPAWIAGNRYGMPDEIPFRLNEDGTGDFSCIAQHIPYYNQGEK